MKFHNARFLANPSDYLRVVAIECYPVKMSELTNDLRETRYTATSREVHVPLEFDFVPASKSALFAKLKILGPLGTYSRTRRVGRPVVAAWLPYLGQSSCDPSKFGRICPADVVGNWQYIFTVNLTGCTVVAVREKDKFYFYHEPTQDEWESRPEYDGEVIARASPKYSDQCLAGFAMISKQSDTRFTVVVQSIRFGNTVSDVESFDIDL